MPTSGISARCPSGRAGSQSIYPALLLNYLGQGAYLLSGRPVAGGKLFYNLVPQSMLFPMVLLATVATVIASQALISGAYSLASQAIRLGLFPRLNQLHTHERHAGQIYVAFVDWTLFVGCILLVVTFGSSLALAAAYGPAVSGVVITSIAMFRIAHSYWKWGPVLRVWFGARCWRTMPPS
jgi:KUP system potassium uptake protein